MCVLVIDDPSRASRLADILKKYLAASSVESVSPRAGETPETFAERVAKEFLAESGNKQVVIIINANLRCGAAGSFCSGLNILERLLAVRAVPAVILSFLSDPIRLSVSRRLVDGEGEVLLRHSTIIQRRLPVSVEELARQIAAAEKMPPLDQRRPDKFKTAFFERKASAVRHGHENLRAALRMLDGTRRLNLMSPEEYGDVIDILKTNHPSAVPDLEQLHREIQALPAWSAPPGRADRPAKKVLLIDDEAESSAWRAILSPLCRSVGAELDSAIDLNQGENKLRDYPDAALLDLHYQTVTDPPDPIEVLSRARAANPLVPIIVFTTEREGRHVRDLGVDSFYYFFKEVDEEEGADTKMYAETFRQIIQSAIGGSLASSLRGIVRLSLSDSAGEDVRFYRAQNLLESASSAINRPEVAMCLTTGALIEARAAVADPLYGAAWAHLKNRFDGETGLSGLRESLPKIVKSYRNYASHYEEPPNPPPDVFDAVVYLLSTAQFISDLRAITEDGTLTRAPDRERRLLLEALRRVAVEMSLLVSRPKVLDSALLDILQGLTVCSEHDLKDALEKKRRELKSLRLGPHDLLEALTEKYNALMNQRHSELQFLDRKQFERMVKPLPPRPAYCHVIEAWFGKDLTAGPAICWDSGQSAAPYVLYVCSFLLLERGALLVD
jgi:hypothetical protein